MSYEEEKQDRKIEQLEAEIERLQARDKQMVEAIVSIANRTKRYVLSTHAITEAVFDEADSLVEYCEKLEKIVIARDARIQELKDALVEVRARSFSGWVEESRVVWDVVRHQFWIEGKIGPSEEQIHAKMAELPSAPGAYRPAIREEAIRQLQAEGKIGPEDTKPQEGLYGKYLIRKSDGSPVDSEADYFVLRLDTDPVARRGALEYSYMTPDRDLARGLQDRLAKYDPKMMDCINLQFFGLERPRVWQITDERRDAIRDLLNGFKDYHTFQTIRAMLREAGQ